MCTHTMIVDQAWLGRALLWHCEDWLHCVSSVMCQAATQIQCSPGTKPGKSRIKRGGLGVSSKKKQKKVGTMPTNEVKDENELSGFVKTRTTLVLATGYTET